MKREGIRTASGYRAIAQRLASPLTENELQIITALQEQFSKRDLYFVRSESELVFHFRAVDLQKFKSALNRLTKPLDPVQGTGSKNIFGSIISELESIGSYGVRGGKRLYVGFNDERKVKDRKAKVAKRSMHFYTAGNDFAKGENVLPKKFENQAVCGDSAIILKELPDNCVDLVFTSPPYNFGLGYDTS
ncbi:MAG: hypothetical protein M1368_04235, partial [Thaumarchaeota archaeon]|nr:hypothetical protein [Nitrososphaerota archaeon]